MIRTERYYAQLAQAFASLQAGDPAIFPTDTVYGIGVSVLHADGPEKLFSLKGRDEGKPVAWLVGDVSDLARFGDGVPAYAYELARSGWPGSLTLIVRASDKVPARFASAAGTIGLRLPDSDTVRSLVKALGSPLATTSANLSGGRSARRFAELPACWSDIAFVCADEGVKSGVPSRVVSCLGNQPIVLRA